MLALSVMLLALVALVGAGFCFITGSSWIGLGLVGLSNVLEFTAFALAGRAEAEE